MLYHHSDILRRAQSHACRKTVTLQLLAFYAKSALFASWRWIVTYWQVGTLSNTKVILFCRFLLPLVVALVVAATLTVMLCLPIHATRTADFPQFDCTEKLLAANIKRAIPGASPYTAPIHSQLAGKYQQRWVIVSR